MRFTGVLILLAVAAIFVGCPGDESANEESTVSPGKEAPKAITAADVDQGKLKEASDLIIAQAPANGFSYLEDKGQIAREGNDTGPVVEDLALSCVVKAEKLEDGSIDEVVQAFYAQLSRAGERSPSRDHPDESEMSEEKRNEMNNNEGDSPDGNTGDVGSAVLIQGSDNESSGAGSGQGGTETEALSAHRRIWGTWQSQREELRRGSGKNTIEHSNDYYELYVISYDIPEVEIRLIRNGDLKTVDSFTYEYDKRTGEFSLINDAGDVIRANKLFQGEDENFMQMVSMDGTRKTIYKKIQRGDEPATAEEMEGATFEAGSM